MTTILILNAISSLLAAAGMTGALMWKRRMARRRAQSVAVYVLERR
jgi:hypothetical protein